MSHHKILVRCIFKIKRPWDVISEINSKIDDMLFNYNYVLKGVPLCYFLKAVGNLAKIDEESRAEVETNIEFIVNRS